MFMSDMNRQEALADETIEVSEDDLEAVAGGGYDNHRLVPGAYLGKTGNNITLYRGISGGVNYSIPVPGGKTMVFGPQ
jgi:hypothetical protein